MFPGDLTIPTEVVMSLGNENMANDKRHVNAPELGDRDRWRNANATLHGNPAAVINSHNDSWFPVGHRPAG
jgi:hypothetical protein